MEFEFNHQLLPQSLLEVENIGSVSIEATNTDGFCYYMIIQTKLGTTSISTCGPVIPDIDLLPSGFTIYHMTLPYKEDKINKIIDNFLNDRYKKLVSAKIIDESDALDQFRDIRNYIENFNGV